MIAVLCRPRCALHQVPADPMRQIHPYDRQLHPFGRGWRPCGHGPACSVGPAGSGLALRGLNNLGRRSGALRRGHQERRARPLGRTRRTQLG